jgi:hypothetical protein
VHLYLRACSFSSSSSSVGGMSCLCRSGTALRVHMRHISFAFPLTVIIPGSSAWRQVLKMLKGMNKNVDTNAFWELFHKISTPTPSPKAALSDSQKAVGSPESQQVGFGLQAFLSVMRRLTMKRRRLMDKAAGRSSRPQQSRAAGQPAERSCGRRQRPREHLDSVAGQQKLRRHLENLHSSIMPGMSSAHSRKMR